ncbi:CPBP family intramembrane glutamic endopeptidase [Pseudogracilibacillus sp. SO30301A]|uniref:CPBP family intramembrane glutamic endopeptidase n=1 Tax=Pseudogracilibacillus sp. SO30301A TaxID=3098291 RepID=UPI00300E15E3
MNSDNRTYGEWSGLDICIVFVAWLILSTETLFNGAGRIFDKLFSSPVIADYMGAIVIHLVQLIIVGVFVLSKHQISWENFGFRSISKQNMKKLFIWSIIGLILNATFLSLTALMWSGEASKTDTIQSTGFFLSIVMVAIIAPIVEEIVFRGVIYKYFRVKLGVPIAILLNGFLFGISHAPSWELVLNAAVMGVFFAYIYERSGTLWIPIIVHGITNATVTTLFFLFVGT